MITVNVTNTTVAPGFDLFAMRTPWNESEATWIGPTTTSTWEEPGVTDPADFVPTVLGTMSGTAIGPLTVILNSAGRAVVTGWLNDPASNHGLLISNPANTNSLRFDSREATTTACWTTISAATRPPTPSWSPVRGARSARSGKQRIWDEFYAAQYSNIDKGISMSIFSRSRNRIGTGTATRTITQPGSRSLIFEPLEDRRLLAAAPLNFSVANTGGPGVELAWTDNPDATGGYEIQSSVNGLDDEANPDAWKTGLWRTTATADAGDDEVSLTRYRSYYFRIQSLPAESTPLWSPIVFTSAPAEDNVVKVSAAVLPGVEMITLRWPEELKFASSTYTISRKAKDDLTWTELVSGDTGSDWIDFDVEEGEGLRI